MFSVCCQHSHSMQHITAQAKTNARNGDFSQENKNVSTKIDIVDDFIGAELELFEEEYKALHHIIKQRKIETALASYVVRYWKKKTEIQQTPAL